MSRPPAAELAAAGAPVLYTPEQAAEIIPKTAYWLRNSARKGTVPFTRIGRTILFTPADLAEIARAGQQKPRPVLAARTPARKRAGAGGEPVPLLRARTPPRRRKPGAA